MTPIHSYRHGDGGTAGALSPGGEPWYVDAAVDLIVEVDVDGDVDVDPTVVENVDMAVSQTRNQVA